jgi:MSHA type pilus biogenesis protein MshL
MLLRTLSATLAALLLAACASPTLKEPSHGHLRTESVAITPGTIPPPVQQTRSLPRPKPLAKTETYSVVVNKVPVHDLLFALARDAKLNVDIHPGIIGEVTLNAIDQTLPQLLNRIAKQVDMRFELDGPNLAVMPDSPFLKIYRVDYVNISRDVSGTVSTNTQIASSAVIGSAGGAASVGNTSRIKIENTSKNHFWESLEKNIKELLYETDKVLPEGSSETTIEQDATQSTTGTGAQAAPAKGKGKRSTAETVLGLAGSPNPATLQSSGDTVIKRMTFREAASVIANAETGVISVRATSRQHEKVQEFIDRVMSSARRQVLIEATIVEVELSDGYQQGIEWSRLRSDGSGFSITPPTLGGNASNSVTPFVFKLADNRNPLNLLAAVNLLQSFGNLKVLSSPKLSVLNNQTATLKVSEEYVYFSVKADITPGVANSSPVTAVTTTPQSVSVGFFMSVTPQISEGDTVTLNVRPSISSISDLKQDPNPYIPSGILNLVPQIRTREIESMLRIESGDIAVLGGLMEDRIDNKSGRVPVLGAIPLFGELLNNRSNTSKKSELVIFLRPTVIKDASDFSKLGDFLPGKNFLTPSQVFQPFSVPESFAGSAQ